MNRSPKDPVSALRGIDPTATEYLNYTKLASHTLKQRLDLHKSPGPSVGCQQTGGTTKASQPEENGSEGQAKAMQFGKLC